MDANVLEVYNECRRRTRKQCRCAYAGEWTFQRSIGLLRVGQSNIQREGRGAGVRIRTDGFLEYIHNARR